jgi:choline kinase
MKAIILAAGLGTRIGKLTESIPKCLIPFGNSTILESSIKKLQSIGLDDILVVAGYKANLIKKVYKNIIINEHYDTTQPPYSLRLALETIETSCDLLILDGDLIFEEKLIKDLIKNKEKNQIVTYRATSKTEAGSRVETTSKGEVSAIGRYISPLFPYYLHSGITFISKKDFSIYKELLLQEVYKKTEMHIVLNDFCKRTTLYVFDTELYQLKKEQSKESFSGGSFANLKITKEKDLIIKETNHDIARLSNEISYLKNLPSKLKPYFSKILKYKIDTKKNYAYYTMPRYNELSLKKLILSGKITTNQTFDLLINLLTFMKNNIYSLNKTTKNIDKYIESVHFYRVYARKEITIKRAPIFKDIFEAKKIIINNTEYENVMTIIDRMTMCKNLIKFLTPDFLCMIHGDLHFDNILVDTSIIPFKFRLVDPKGFSAGDPMYDVSKLLHDFNGRYDFIYEYMFDLDYKIENEVLYSTLNITDCKAKTDFLKLNNYFPLEMDRILRDISSNWYYRAKFIEAINFSCLQPYHLVRDDKERKAIAMYLIGVILLNHFWDALPASLKIIKRKYNIININTIEDFTYAKNLFKNEGKFPAI